VIRVFKWLPIIWKTYDFDYRSAVNVFAFQLSEIAKLLDDPKRSWSANGKHYASRIRMVVRLMEKVYDEDYGTEFMDEIKRLYGDSKIEFQKIEGTDTFEMVVVYEKDYTPEEIEKIEEHQRELIRLSNAKEERAHKLLWQLIEHNIRNWWD